MGLRACGQENPYCLHVSWVLWVVVATLGALLLWGLFAPRSNWRSLTGWSVSDAHRDEPGTGTYAARRIVSALGAAALAVVLVSQVSSFIANLPKPPPPLSPVELMWGFPDPQVVDRVVTAISAAPATLPAVPIEGYQAFPGTGAPSYLTRLRRYTLRGDVAPAGIIGRAPDVGRAAIDGAALVVQVRGPLVCMPRQAVVIESETSVRIGIFYGLPDSTSGAAVDQISGCPANSAFSQPLLIPIVLASPVGDRTILALDGSVIDKVRILTAVGKN